MVASRPNPSSGGEDQGSKHSMLHFPHLLLILSFFLLVHVPVDRRGHCRAITRCVRVVNPYVKKFIFIPEISCMDVQPSTVISVGGPCDQGTSVRNKAVMSRILLWRIVGKPLMWQIIAWSTTENWTPLLHVWEMLPGLQPYLKQIASLHSPLCR